MRPREELRRRKLETSAAGLRFRRASVAVVRELVLVPVVLGPRERAVSGWWGCYKDHSAAAWRVCVCTYVRVRALQRQSDAYTLQSLREENGGLDGRPTTAVDSSGWLTKSRQNREGRGVQDDVPG